MCMWYQKLGGNMPKTMALRIFRLAAALGVTVLILYLVSFFFGDKLVMGHAFFWNLFLAFLPLGFSVLLARRVYAKKRGPLNVLWSILWLVFFPNAPYMLTDLIHISLYEYPYGYSETPASTPWLELAQITASVIVGCLLGCLSLYIVHSLVRRRGAMWGWVFCGGISVLSGLGMFIGRFMRFNTWDLLHRPATLLEQLAQRSVAQTIGFCTLFATMTFGIYLLFYFTFDVPGGAPPEETNADVVPSK